MCQVFEKPRLHQEPQIPPSSILFMIVVVIVWYLVFKFCPCVVVYLHYFNWKLPFFNPQNLPNPTKPTLRFTFHSLSSIFFDTLKSPPSTVYIHLFRAERPLTFLASTSAPAASSTRQISAWPSLAASCSAVHPLPSFAATAPGTVRSRCRIPPRWPRQAARTMSLPPRRATGRPGAPVAGRQRPQRRPKKSWNTSNVLCLFLSQQRSVLMCIDVYWCVLMCIVWLGYAWIVYNEDIRRLSKIETSWNIWFWGHFSSCSTLTCYHLKPSQTYDPRPLAS